MRIRNALATAALGTALAISTAAVPSQAAAAAPATSSDGCASLYSNAAGRAQIRNLCNYTIWATVSVDWSWDPSCIEIPKLATRTITWDAANGRAEYAYEC
ncbi:hypothetical protein [Streptomyces acidicola]|uniref:hypothetical protein n=1 Tax=Streptomyces acidicola TaxID=2596892 RepID=UPI003436BF4C